MNVIALMGRLTADPELKTTTSGINMTRFSIAVDRAFQKQGEQRQADFINIIAWRQSAEFITRYFRKGSMIAITGSLQSGSYTDKDGNKRYTYDVVVDRAEFCGSKAESGSSSYTRNDQPASFSNADPGDFEEISVGDDDLPF